MLVLLFHAIGLLALAGSAEAARDVVLCALVGRIGEDLGRVTHLDKLAEVEEGRALGDARGLLHRVGDDDDAVVLP